MCGLALCRSGQAQTPQIASVAGQSPAGNVSAITSGNAQLPPAFLLLINGTFNPQASPLVTWRNTVTGATQTFSGSSIIANSATQIQVMVSSFLYGVPVASSQPVDITVTEGSAVSNTGRFAVNPPPVATGFVLAPGAVGTPYSQPLATGGTPPFTYDAGGTPPGLILKTDSPVMAGTPTTAGTYFLQAAIIDAWGSIASSEWAVVIYPKPVITQISPASAPAGSPQVLLNISGSGFVPPASCQPSVPSFVVASPDAASGICASSVSWTTSAGTVLLSAGSNSATSITVPLPANLLALPTVATVQVVQPDGTASNPATFTVFGTLAIATTALPSALTGTPYSFQLSATGGVGRYSWGASGLPPGFALNAATGLITGTTGTAGTFPIIIGVTDSTGQTVQRSFSLQVSTPPPPPVSVTGTLPQGQVGVAYSAGLTIRGGSGTYQVSLSGGSLPPGLSLGPGAGISGTPTTAGTFAFSVQVSDSGGTSDTGSFSITIIPAPLTVTGSVSGGTVGTPISAAFGATGGVPPYTFGVSGAIPSGTTFTNGTLSGTPNSPGTFAFSVSVSDSAHAGASKSFTVVIAAPAFAISGTPGNGQVGVAYSAQLTAAGGTPPYSWTAAGLPPGIAFTAGSFAGTPTTPGTFAVVVTVADAAGNHAAQTYTVVIGIAPLTITTASLGDAAVGVAFTVELQAGGGVPPYSWTASGLPPGLNASGAAISGTPSAAGTYNVNVRVADSRGTSAAKSFTLVVAVPPLVITTASLPAITVGTPFSTTLSASGGIPPYRWSGAGLPAGVTLGTDGVLAGTISVPGTSSLSVTVTDTAGASASRAYSLTITLPASPPVNFTGSPATANPASQPTIGISVGTPYPVDVTVEYTLTFKPDSGPDDPAIQFSTGGRTSRATIPAGATAAVPTVALQTGTVAGVITITSRLTAAGQDITPVPPPATTIRINATAPVITSLTATRTANGFTVVAVGYSSSREVTQASFTFTAAAGSSLQTTQATVPVDATFAQWFGSTAAAPFGGQFTFTQMFTITGNQLAIASVSVNLSNRVGTSNTVSATLQ